MVVDFPPVRAKKAEHLPSLNDQIEAIERDIVAEVFGQFFASIADI